jgi:hypothetical protein
MTNFNGWVAPCFKSMLSGFDAKEPILSGLALSGLKPLKVKPGAWDVLKD